MKPEVKCCQDGAQFIRWMTAKEADAEQDGFYLPIHTGYPDCSYMQVVRCPFCGGLLPPDKSWMPEPEPCPDCGTLASEFHPFFEPDADGTGWHYTGKGHFVCTTGHVRAWVAKAKHDES